MTTDKPMPQIFLSYRWSNSDIADAIDNDFKAIGIIFLRDVRDVKYRGSIKEFMNRVGKSDFIVMIISDEYLRSINCMYEVMELLNSHEFEKRILPVKLENAKAAFSAKERKLYYDYWKKEMDQAKERLNEHINEDTQEQHKRCKTIYDRLGEFLQKLTDLNVLAYETLKQQNYKPILDILGIENGAILAEVIAIEDMEDFEEKDIALEGFLIKFPTHKYGLFLKAYICGENKLYKKAIKYYQNLLDIHPMTENANYNLAVLVKTKFLEYELARNYYEKEIIINSNHTDAHYNLANLFMNNLKEYALARHHYEKVIDINPNDLESHNNLGNLLKDYLQEYSLAKIHYEKAIDINPDYPKAHFNLAILLLEKFNDEIASKQHYIIATNLDSKSINRKLDEHFGIKR